MRPTITIVGQGIAGSLLAYELQRRDYEVTIYDPNNIQETSSLKAAGLYNPITGRKMNVTWMASELFEGLANYYDELDELLGIHSHHSLPIYRPFLTHEEQNDWAGKASDERYAPFLKEVKSQPIGHAGLSDPFGGVVLRHTGYVDLPVLLEGLRDFFIAKDMMRHEWIGGDDIRDFHTDKIVFCEGVSALQNPYWEALPFRPVRGEILDISCALPTNMIYNRGVFVMPKAGIFRVGSTYHHDVLSYSPQQKGIDELQQKFSKLFTGEKKFA